MQACKSDTMLAELELGGVKSYAIVVACLEVLPNMEEGRFNVIVPQKDVVNAFDLPWCFFQDFIIPSCVGISCCCVSLWEPFVPIAAPFSDERCEGSGFLVQRDGVVAVSCIKDGFS